jgi:hypothetical protein
MCSFFLAKDMDVSNTCAGAFAWSTVLMMQRLLTPCQFRRACQTPSLACCLRHSRHGRGHHGPCPRHGPCPHHGIHHGHGLQEHLQGVVP